MAESCTSSSTDPECLPTFVCPPLHQTVVIVDTSNEIAGDGDIPHPKAVGQSRRMMVPSKEAQHRCSTPMRKDKEGRTSISSLIGAEIMVVLYVLDRLGLAPEW